MRSRWLIAGVMVLGFLGLATVGPNKVPTAYTFPTLRFFPPMPTNPANPVTVEGVELGRHLFYDPILSRDSSISCGSCHRQSAAFSDGPNVLSAGIEGRTTARNAPPLFNLAWAERYFWDGRAGSLEEQVFHPVRDHREMDLSWPEVEQRLQRSRFYRPKFTAAFGSAPIDSVLVSRAIAQFERTLISADSKLDRTIRRKTLLTADEYEGFVLVNDQTKGNCLHCHTTDGDVLGTTNRFSNSGLDAADDTRGFADPGRGAITGLASDYGTFRIPSLRNVALTAPYMHDGRFNTLKEVLDFYGSGLKTSYTRDSKMGPAHQTGNHLTEDEKVKIIAFLHALTDSTFITNPDYANPFEPVN